MAPGSRRRHHPVWAVVGLVTLALMVVGVAVVVVDERREEERQEALDPFYTPPPPTPDDEVGRIIRSEPLPADTVRGGEGWRILYWSEDADGDLVAASGMVFLPDGDAPAGGREILAWAHGTVGLGARCAPSRTDDVTSGFTWIDLALANGWVVTATDYAGLGTPGTEPYLIGEDEARDVLNSVRAAQHLLGDERPAETVGERFAVYGHSQGGHSALWTGDQAPSYAPELDLVAVAAMAPAAELVPLMHLQYDTAIAWMIGPDVAASWPQVYPDLPLEGVLSGAGQRNYERIARECVLDAAVEGLVRDELFRQAFFAVDPTTREEWVAATTEQTAPLLTGGVPVFVGDSTVDEVVLPETTALYVERSCDAGVTVQTLWLDDSQGLGHAGLGNTAGPTVLTWIEQRFAGVPAPDSCGATLPVTPAEPVPEPSGS